LDTPVQIADQQAKSPFFKTNRQFSQLLHVIYSDFNKVIVKMAGFLCIVPVHIVFKLHYLMVSRRCACILLRPDQLYPQQLNFFSIFALHNQSIK